MHYGFMTKSETKAKAALIIYAVYRSRIPSRAPSGLDMWAKIERFARSASKRSESIEQFLQLFKKRMGCETLNPRWLKDIKSANAMMDESGNIMVFNDECRSFGVELFDTEPEEQKEVVQTIYESTQTIILLVRDRLEREKIAGVKEQEGEENEN